MNRLKLLPDFVWRNKFKKIEFQKKSEYSSFPPEREAEPEEANCITSETLSGYHYPLLDLDLEAVLIPSSTPGHSHLYINKKMYWSEYAELLSVLAEVGIISQEYLEHSFNKGCTTLRMPDVKKEPGDYNSPPKAL